jgi:hypothetical protein
VESEENRLFIDEYEDRQAKLIKLLDDLGERIDCLVNRLQVDSYDMIDVQMRFASLRKQLDA